MLKNLPHEPSLLKFKVDNFERHKTKIMIDGNHLFCLKKNLTLAFDLKGWCNFAHSV